MSTEESRREAARQRVQQIASFYRQVIVFVVVLAFLATIDFLTTPDNWWVHWVALVWGFFILMRAFATFSPIKLFGKDWEERKIAELMNQNASEESLPD